MTTKPTGQHTQGKLEQRNSTRVYSAGRHVADCGSRNPEGLPRHIGLEDAANAAFIVRACNNHDALVGALQGYKDMTDNILARKEFSNNDFETMKTALTFILPQTVKTLTAATKET